MLLAISGKQSFADAVSREGSFWRLLNVLERKEPNEDLTRDDSARAMENSLNSPSKDRGWLVLEGLSSSPSVASEMVTSSGWIELLGILTGYTRFTSMWSGQVRSFCGAL